MRQWLPNLLPRLLLPRRRCFPLVPVRSVRGYFHGDWEQNKHVVKAAARFGSRAILHMAIVERKWKGCLEEVWLPGGAYDAACCLAAWGGHLEILKWARKNTFPAMKRCANRLPTMATSCRGGGGGPGRPCPRRVHDLLVPRMHPRSAGSQAWLVTPRSLPHITEFPSQLDQRCELDQRCVSHQDGLCLCEKT